MADKFKWGIVGTGKISSDFATAVKLCCPEAQVWAVSSRSQSSSDSFGKDHGIPVCYGSLDALVSDPQINAIYVGTLHPFHKDAVHAALSKGKAVLCEKPFTLNAKDLNVLIDLAKEKNTFLMEAMWTRHFPATKEYLSLIRSGNLGKVVSLVATFGFEASPAMLKEGRIIDPALGGGALLDIGVYLVALAFSVFRSYPTSIKATSRLLNGVDIQTSFILDYPEGQAVLSCGFGSEYYANTAEITLTRGSITVPTLWCPQEFTVNTQEGSKKHEFPLPPNSHTWNFRNSIGLHYEALAVQKYVAEKATESVELPLAESLQIMQVMDAIRAQIGVVYPGEAK